VLQCVAVCCSVLQCVADGDACREPSVGSHSGDVGAVGRGHQRCVAQFAHDKCCSRRESVGIVQRPEPFSGIQPPCHFDRDFLDSCATRRQRCSDTEIDGALGHKGREIRGVAHRQMSCQREVEASPQIDGGVPPDRHHDGEVRDTHT